ncbi:MAG TPA: helix-turn-helix transcriptional regulator [Thermoanaerobaculia bacterium]|nr:helix-turn-helix transcriptional regulator [Thermoanaerobaculia bacterium]
MLHEQIREARLKAGLSQVKLAELAGIQRSLIQNLEDGRNVTLDTLRKIVPHLPSVQSLNLGSFDPKPSVTAALRNEVRQMISAGQHILDLLDGPSQRAAAPPRVARRAGGRVPEKPRWQEGVNDTDLVREAIAEATAIIEGRMAELQDIARQVASKKA